MTLREQILKEFKAENYWSVQRPFDDDGKPLPRNTPPAFREACRMSRTHEADYASVHNAAAKAWGHVGKFPKGPPDGGKMPGHVTVKQKIAKALKRGTMTRAEVCEAVGRSKGHISAELSQMARMGIIRKDTIMDGGIALPAWRLL